MGAPINVRCGDRYGRLQIISTVPHVRTGLRAYECLCDCGNTYLAVLKSLRSGNTLSCGCLRRDMVAAKNHKHGHRRRNVKMEPEYYTWKRMRQRCYDAHTHEWERYGGRGIVVCERWTGFTLFLADMGPRPSPMHSLDRFPDTNGNYEPGNCRWATASQQARNKGNTRWVTLGGDTMSLADAVEKHNAVYRLVSARLRLGWDIMDALTLPAGSKKPGVIS